MKDIADRVKHLRERKSLSQSDLARRAKIPQTTISRIETRLSFQLRADTLQRLADALDTTIDYLVGRTGKSAGTVDLDPAAARAFARDFAKLSAGAQEEVLKYIRWRANEERKK